MMTETLHTEEKVQIKPIILCVDDERIILDSLKVQLMKYFDGNCLVEIAESGDEGLEIIEDLIDEDGVFPHVIISDQIMPGMKGDEFLIQVSQRSPSSIRILLTGQAQKDDIINVINKAGLYRYIAKPWDNMDLNLTVREALVSFSKSKEIEAQRDQLLILNQNLEQKVQQRTMDLENQMQKTEELLHNILPAEVVQELKETGSVQPRHFNQATIAFMDIVGFTLHTKDLQPQEIIDQLNQIFKEIDLVIGEYGLEKIKTMGDGYMFGGGIPVPNQTNAVDVVHACVEILERIKELKKVHQFIDSWELRIGVHTGELIAGVIGSKKFTYDVWGQTVNIASRMESAGAPGRINISASTYNLIKEEFSCENRGKLAVKNMEDLEMYFVNGRL
ncbi:adenylate/guanylate cyclase domain-containing protein [Marinoscillum pacificum]|uniref:adenylate/guanylate cyclase domain-containing protein n=1 Tax=Marinoscillum pacificum TaxID=392723 RepID=UPI002158454F|nr:adenylate/guanylate cyclase domain-containing protein [Marinoscillum pacificum]